MNPEQILAHLQEAMRDTLQNDRYLLANNLSERCIAARIAMHLQTRFADFSVDVGYNRHGAAAKKLGLPDECANKRDENGDACVIPDIIVHSRGEDGPNLLVVELKKTTNPDCGACDRLRIRAFCDNHDYEYLCGALILCETRSRREPRIDIVEWVRRE